MHKQGKTAMKSSSAGAAQNEKIAFFDVDHTITKGATPIPFAVVCAKRKMIKKRYFLLLPIFYILYRFFNIKMGSLFNLILPYIEGVPQSTLLSVGKEAFETRVRDKCFRDALEEIRLLEARGVRVVLATSSPLESIVFLARYCGLEEADIISSRFCYKDDIFAGRLEGDPVFSQSKRDAALEFLKENDTAPSECSFYSDSVHDLPLLEAVGRPVAVNPDRRLRREAKRRGWEIRRFR